LCACKPCNGYTFDDKFDPSTWNNDLDGVPACVGVYDPKNKGRAAEVNSAFPTDDYEIRNILQRKKNEKFALSAKVLKFLKIRAFIIGFKINPNMCFVIFALFDYIFLMSVNFQNVISVWTFFIL